MTEDFAPFPTADDREFGYLAAKLALGVVPGVGPLAQEFLEKAVGNPIRRRQEAWMGELGEAVAALSGKVEGITPERLAEDEVFVSAVARTTQAALATHSQVKRTALRNIVLNTALGVRLDEALLGAFLGYVERFSEAHLKLLALMSDPMGDTAYARHAADVYMGSVQGVVEKAHPDLCAQPGILDRLYDDLTREGLLGGSPKAICSAQGLTNPQTTDYGAAFLAFIREPSI